MGGVTYDQGAFKLQASRKIHSKRCRYLQKVCVPNSRIHLFSFSHCSLVIYDYSSFVRFYTFFLFLSKHTLYFSLRWIWATAATCALCHQFLTEIFDVFSVFFSSLVRYVSKEYASIPHSRLIPYSYSLPRFS